ncbi:neuroglian isoform X2 [Copidosoma floridanum]|uniref:neuroglian isoform X2 n=1 Tax=Copidosoma floridanum TaxID=29053 RepID=UPI0006C9C0FE|nr:neuroglian isoform X2 [Copidosoma floridanum]
MRFAGCIIATLVLHVAGLNQSPPRITKQPPTDEVLFQVAQVNENEKPFLIECEAEGEPAPVYEWIKNGKDFKWQAYDDRISQQPGRGTLVISKPRDEDIGQYQCFARNEWGIATSNSVFVRKSELSSFKVQSSEKVSEVEGSPLKLTCQPPDGWPKPNVYWLIQDKVGNIKSINNSRMTLDPEGNLWFSNVTKHDASVDFFYACAATSDFRNEYKIGNRVVLDVISAGSSANLNKREPVKQYVSRKNEVAHRGKKIELFCIYGGTPLPLTTWYKNGQKLQPNDRVTEGNYGKTLVIKHVNFEDKGTYSCDVSNGVGSAQSNSINLEVRSVPYFTVEPEIINASEDETVEFKCEARGAPEPQIKWIYNGKPISEAPYNPRRKVTPNSIILENLLKNDTGNYGCNATNSLGYVYKDVYVNVQALEPEILQPPMDEATVDGKTIRLTCHVFGAPKPEVKWLRNGQELTGGRYKILETGDLEIEDVLFSDAGEYQCHASNKLGKVNASGLLAVKEHTKITDVPEDYEVKAGDMATFRCNAVTDSTLKLKIDWLSKGEPIIFGAEPRFVKTSDHSLVITKTTELDSGTYTCVARTDLDETQAQATLIVQDVPNSPTLQSVNCGAKEAYVSWIPKGDNRSPILRYTIQYNTSFTPDTWENAKDHVPATEQRYAIQMSPWANYTFRVIAWNKVGPSQPSSHSQVCTTLPDIPFKNPDNINGRGDDPQNLIISWTAMPQIEHNAPKFMYRVYYKRDIPGEKWTIEDVHNWKQNTLRVNNQPTYERYRIKVAAINEKGECRVQPEEIIGYSGEDVPLQAPGNFSLVQVRSSTTALLQWTPVPPESVKGELKGYKIQTWTETDGKESMREYNVQGGNKTYALVNNFKPFSMNFVKIRVYNGRYNGPHSEVLSFKTPEGVPGTVMDLQAHPIGSTAMLLKWSKPIEINGILTGYRISYQLINGSKVGSEMERHPQITDPEASNAILPSLMPKTKYRISIRATTRAGPGEPFFVEKSTPVSKRPDVPTFSWLNILKESGLSNVRITWDQKTEGFAGSYFFAKYRLKGETIDLVTKPEKLANEIEIRGLESGRTYIMSIVAVDGNYMTESLPQEVETSNEGPIIEAQQNVATAGWFIGMMTAIIILLLILIIVCAIKRNRGGKYAVHERELAAGRGDFPDEGGFHEYSQPLDSKSGGGRTSMASSHHDKNPESDTDSMAEYGEGDTARFTEDGSFIGQYGPKGRPIPIEEIPPPIPTGSTATYV